MDTIVALVSSPIGPALVLLIGAITEFGAGRWLRRPGPLTGLALFFVAAAALLFVWLRLQTVVPVFSRPWQPLLQNGANLLWVSDGWNWYISGLVLLLGGLGILLELNTDRSAEGARLNLRLHTSLAVHLAVLAAALLFVGSGNLLTVIMTWVALDIIILVRTALRPPAASEESIASGVRESQAKALSLTGAMLLLIGLLPAGPSGPGQPLEGGVLPVETVVLMFVAAIIRAGIYPFHLWLLPRERSRINLSERLLDHMVPVLSGLWLLGWTVDLGAARFSLSPLITALLVLSLLASALAAWTARKQTNHAIFVLTTSAGLAALAGVLAYSRGPAALLWPTTAFALGGALWLIGERVWAGWGWQIPVSVGALTLAGAPFTPGFLTQPALSRLLTEGGIFFLLFWVYVLAQGLQIAAMLRSWGPGEERSESTAATNLRSNDMVRLLLASIAIGLPLAAAGFLPTIMVAVVNLPDAIPELLGEPPSVVAEWPVWVTLVLPFAAGMALVWLQSRLWPRLGEWPVRISRLTRLEWLFDLVWWGAGQISATWGGGLRALEGAGYMGWTMIFALLLYLLVR